jgi:DNA polymerase III delta prime subunit
MELWVEKYRPSSFDTIVLEETNQLFFKKMIDTNYIPNLLFYGPPGTGKTTTILNLIQTFQEKQGEVNSSLVIHLNASDERGIDTIRSQIYSFVHTKPFFSKGKKFVILDEVDSMTKSAQQALSYLLHTPVTVSFCLICNYISKIEDTLQTLFIKVKFNALPVDKMLDFLETIVKKEGIQYTRAHLEGIQRMYGSDIRSMINYLQTNQYNPSLPIQSEAWETLYALSLKESMDYVDKLSELHNMDPKHIIKEYVYYLALHKSISISSLELVFHTTLSTKVMLQYVLFIIKLI